MSGGDSKFTKLPVRQNQSYWTKPSAQAEELIATLQATKYHYKRLKLK